MCYADISTIGITPMTTEILESKKQSKIIKWANRLQNTYAFKVNPPPNGIPDVHIISHGVPFYFEIKRTDKDHARKLQKYRIKQLRKAGGNAQVIRSLDEAKEVVARVLLKHKVKLIV